MFEQSLLNALYLIPFLGSVAVAAVVPAGRSPEFYRRWALGLSSLPLIAALHLVYTFVQAGSAADAGGPYTVNFSWFRVQDLEVRYALFIDGLSLPLVLIAALLVPIGIAHSRVEERPREYYALCLLAEGAWIGTFLAGDFFLFSVFWTASLVPVSFLIGLQGGPEREYAAGRFFLYGLAGSVTMILAGIWLSTAVPVGTLLLRSLPGQPFLPGMPEVVPAALARAPELRPLALAAWWGLFLA